MVTKDTITEQMKKAAKTKDKATLSILRFALAAINNKEKEVRHELSEQETFQVLSSLVKKAKESIEQFQRGNRSDLVSKEENELEVLQAFLPQQLTPEELGEEISKVLKESGASSAKDVGTVMKILMPRIAGRADGRLVNEMVRERLSK